MPEERAEKKSSGETEDPCLLGSGHYFDKFKNSFCSLFVSLGKGPACVGGTESLTNGLPGKSQ